jgi:hypothetical protein
MNVQYLHFHSKVNLHGTFPPFFGNNIVMKKFMNAEQSIPDVSNQAGKGVRMNIPFIPKKHSKPPL